MADDQDIREKLAKLEALFALGATVGERAAAGARRDRLQAKLSEAADEGDEPESELQYFAAGHLLGEDFCRFMPQERHSPLPLSSAAAHDGDGPGAAIELRADGGQGVPHPAPGTHWVFQRNC